MLHYFITFQGVANSKLHYIFSSFDMYSYKYKTDLLHKNRKYKLMDFN
jgi:hypothetical protein